MIMKNLLLLFLLSFSLSGSAQKVLSGSFELPANEKYLALDWDCSQTLFDKKFTEKEWKSMKGEDWDIAKKEVIETEEKKEDNNENNKMDNNGNNYYSYNNNMQQYKKNKYRFKKYS